MTETARNEETPGLAPDQIEDAGLGSAPVTASARRSLRAGVSAQHAVDRDRDRPVLDGAVVRSMLLGSWPELRVAARKLAARSDMHRIDGLSMTEHRKRVFEQLRALVAAGQVSRAFPVEVGGGDDHGGNVVGFEELVLADPSLQIKAGVQWGLFGAAVMHLGTERHHRALLPDIMSLAVPGAFAMTETGHGSDVASIGTTATYDPNRQQFVIDTPSRAAWKDYIGNAALHAKAAVVFAQLITRGENHGVHAFYVPIRGVKGQFLRGIGGEDDGLKGGLNGVDNGRLHFSNVRIPRENLLNRYGDVAPDGSYSSPIASPGRRFFTMLGTLVQGRVSLDGSATTASAVALAIAIRYGSQRRQFRATPDSPEEVLLDYQRHQRRLLPKLATTYAQAFAHDELLVMFDSVFSGKTDTDADRQHLETVAAALKPLSTWHALETLQEAREACGGAGFLATNRLVGLRADLDIYTTFEGDNNVLLQLVAKRLLTDYSKKLTGGGSRGMARVAIGSAANRVYRASGLRRAVQNVADLGSTARSVLELRDPDTQHSFLAGRVDAMVASLAARLRSAPQLPREEAAALFNRNQNELIEAARAHGELLQWEAFTRAIDRVSDEDTRQVLTWLRDLFGLSLLEKHLSWYLVNGQLSVKRAATVTAYIDRLLARLRPYALELVNAFAFEPEHLRADIAVDSE